MYLVKALAAASAPVAPGALNVQWAATEVRHVDVSLIEHYRAHPAVFTIMAGPDAVDVAIALAAELASQEGIDAGARNGATVTATETAPRVHSTLLTLVATPLTLRDTEQGAGVKIYDFPLGRILILDAKGSVAMKTTSILADTLNASKTCNWGVGTVTQANATLATTEQDIINVEDITSSATINVAGAASPGVGVAMTLLDGSETAIDAFLNVSVPTADDIDANATVTLTGTIEISWVNLDE
jgi:hypothetical protein